MTTARGLKLLALALALPLALGACHHAKQDHARRAADLMVSVVETQLDIIKGLEARLEPKPACDAAQKAVVPFIEAKGKALKPRTEELKKLLASLGPEDTARAVKLARPRMLKTFAEGADLAGPEGKIASAFAKRCPDAAKAILAANGKVLKMINSVQAQVRSR